jgi:hypothetical protein
MERYKLQALQAYGAVKLQTMRTLTLVVGKENMERYEKEGFPSVKLSLPWIVLIVFTAGMIGSLLKSDKAPSYSLAYEESYGFFDDITNDQWKMHQKWARQSPMHENNDPLLWYNQSAILIWYYTHYDPIFECPFKKRIGGRGDGPKWTCDPHRLNQVVKQRKAAGEPGPHCIIYSVGSEGNYLFEDSIIEHLGGPICEIHVFDFSGNFDRPENKERNIHFHKWGLKGSWQTKAAHFVSFQEIRERLNQGN